MRIEIRRRDRPSQERSSDTSQPSQMVATAIASNAVLAAAGYNFRWFEQLLRILSLILFDVESCSKDQKDRQKTFRCLSLFKSLLPGLLVIFRPNQFFHGRFAQLRA
jgi:hypothetical protein